MKDENRIGTQNLGRFYTSGRVRNRREWRGVRDTAYDFSRWLYNWLTMFRVVLVKPRNIKAMFRYRWMASYLAVPMMIDRHTQGLRDEHLRICHAEQDLIVEDVAKLLDKLFRGDRRIGNDQEFSKKVVLVDENEMQSVMMGFPTVVPRAALHYIDVAQEYGLAGDVCPMPEAEAGVSIDDDAPVLGCCAVQCNTTCDGSLMGNSLISKRLEQEDGCSSWPRRCATERTTYRNMRPRKSATPSPLSRNTPAKSGTGHITLSAQNA